MNAAYSDEKTRSRKGIKRFMPDTLLGRSLLILVTPVFLIQVVSTFIFFDRHWSKMTSRLAYAVAGEVTMFSEYIERNANDPDAVQAALDAADIHLDLLMTYDEGKRIKMPEQDVTFFGGWETMIQSTLIKELSYVIDRPFKVDVDFHEKWVDVRVQLENGVLNIAMPQRRLFSSTSYIFLLWVFGASGVLLIIAILFMRNQIRPIRRLALAAERFGKGRDVQHFKLEGAREVRQAGQAFLDMKTRIQRQISQRTDMLAGVSHDLRTPLTRLKLQIAMLGDGPDIYEMRKDINDMERMIAGYLNFVRGEGREETKKTNISALLRDVTIAAKRQGCDVTLDLQGGGQEIPLRQTAFKRCIGNIISNAAKYADHVWLSLAQDGEKGVTILIEDNGPGIEEDKFDEVFRPFYRVDSSRNANTGGVGLGLPIAMDIVHSHGGKIWLEKSQHGGLAVYIYLPM